MSANGAPACMHTSSQTHASAGMRLACFNKPFFDEGLDDVGVVAFKISVVICDPVTAIVFIVRDDCAFVQHGVPICSERVCHTLTEIAMRVLG